MEAKAEQHQQHRNDDERRQLVDAGLDPDRVLTTDDLVSDRPGARFGPRAIRAASCPPGPHLEAKVDAMAELRVGDTVFMLAGEFPAHVLPGRVQLGAVHRAKIAVGEHRRRRPAGHAPPRPGEGTNT